MLANNIASATPIAPVAAGSSNETEIVTWTADGLQGFLGFTGTGSYSGTFVLYVKKPTDASPKPYYMYQTSPSNRTAYVADRFIVFPANTILSLRVSHDDSVDAQIFYGTLLGGEL